MLSLHKQHGLSLIELVMVIVITAIIAVVGFSIIYGPVQSYLDQTRRAALVDAAQQAMHRIIIDVHNALPNSIRVSGGTALEMLNVYDGARYRTATGGGATPDQRLEFNKADTDFNVLGRFINIPHPTFDSNTGSEYLVVFNLGPGSGDDAYTLTNVITDGGSQFHITDDPDPTKGEDHVHLDAGYQFNNSSPNHRIYIVDKAIGYLCSGGTLNRYAGYTFNTVQPTTDAAFVAKSPSSSGTVTNLVTGCTFIYDAGASNRAPLVTVALTLTNGGESVHLQNEIQVENVP